MAARAELEQLRQGNRQVLSLHRKMVALLSRIREPISEFKKIYYFKRALVPALAPFCVAKHDNSEWSSLSELVSFAAKREALSKNAQGAGVMTAARAQGTHKGVDRRSERASLARMFFCSACSNLARDAARDGSGVSGTEISSEETLCVPDMGTGSSCAAALCCCCFAGAEVGCGCCGVIDPNWIGADVDAGNATDGAGKPIDVITHTLKPNVGFGHTEVALT